MTPGSPGPSTPAPGRRATMTDVARHADVSLKTVSRVVNGVESVDPEMTRRVKEAAEALGMRRSKVMWRIILPQAMRVIIPPTGNETIGMLKTTSLVLAVPFTLDLTFVTNALASRTFLPIPLLMVAAFWYLVVTSVLMVGQFFIERHFGKGVDNVMKAPVKATAAVAAAHATPVDPADGTTEGDKP